jgi:hypothetical protein
MSDDLKTPGRVDWVIPAVGGHYDAIPVFPPERAFGRSILPIVSPFREIKLFLLSRRSRKAIQIL